MARKRIEMVYVGDKYHNEVIALVESFRYSYCDECGLDLNMHGIVPDPLQHPYIVCLFPLEDLSEDH